MPEAGGGEREETEGVHQGVDATVAEPEAGGALVVDEDGGRDDVERVFADQTIVAQGFDTQEAPVGSKADLPQGGQILESSTDLEVVGVVDGGFGAQGLPCLVVLLDLGFLVLHMQRGDDPSVRMRVRKRPGVRRVTRRSKIRCTRVAFSVERMPLSNGSKAISRWVNWRFSHSCPFRQSFVG